MLFVNIIILMAAFRGRKYQHTFMIGLQLLLGLLPGFLTYESYAYLFFKISKT